jgi:hypothetical protein
MSACEADDNSGFCLDCGEQHSNIEPDARRCKCEACGERRVYGAEEIILMGTCDEDAADDEQPKKIGFVQQHIAHVHVGDSGTTRLNTFVDTENRVLEMPKPKKQRITSIQQLLTGKEQSKHIRQYADKVFSMTGLIVHAGSLIIRIKPGNNEESGSPGDHDKANMINRVFSSYGIHTKDVFNELGTGDKVTINEKTCVRMIDKKTLQHVCTVNELFLRAAEKHGNVYRWYPSIELNVDSPFAIIGLNTAGERVAVIACVIDEA